jgi:hypothetical protein
MPCIEDSQSLAWGIDCPWEIEIFAAKISRRQYQIESLGKQLDLVGSMVYLCRKKVLYLCVEEKMITTKLV